MNIPKPPPPSSNPFASYERPNPFLAPAMPAPQASEVRAQAWGGFSLAETIDDEALPSDLDEQALEILITWGNSVLHVAHLSPPRTFVVGSGTEKEGVDFVLSEEVLKRTRLTVVDVQGDAICAVLPAEATGDLRTDKQKEDLSAVIAASSPYGGAERAMARVLRAGERLTMKLGEVKFNVRLVKKSAPVERGLAAGFDWAVPSYFGMTAATAGLLMGALAYFVPPLGLDDEAAVDKERLVLISQYLDAASEREERQEQTAPETGAEEGGKSGQAASGPEGEAGKEDAPRISARVAVKGPRDNPQLKLSRERALEEAATFGMIGVLSSAQAGDPLAPTSILGGDYTLGADDVSAQGNMWGDEIGESGGMGGLGLSGPGFGGGNLFGNALGIGLKNIGTIGPGLGLEGFGRSDALTKGGHKTRAPNVRPEPIIMASGRIPPQVVQRIVRQNFGRFRMCYQEGLGRNPSLEGRVAVRFVIGRDGAVSDVSTGGGFPDAGVQSCVQSAFYGLSFPPPDGGVVAVTYPLLFSPS